MGDRIVVELALVVTRRDDDTVAHDDRADRHVVVLQRSPSLCERDGHRIVVPHRRHRHDVIGLPVVASIRGADVGDTHGGGSGIRTHGRFPFTRFPSVPVRPLSHPSRIGPP